MGDAARKAELFDQSDGVIQLKQWEYRASDRSCCPSLQSSVFYRWSGTAFEVIKK